MLYIIVIICLTFILASSFVAIYIDIKRIINYQKNILNNFIITEHESGNWGGIIYLIKTILILHCVAKELWILLKILINGALRFLIYQKNIVRNVAKNL